MKRSVETPLQRLKVLTVSHQQRMEEAILALERALQHGRSVSKELEELSELLERGIDVKEIRVSSTDLQWLLAAAKAAEAEPQSPQLSKKKSSPWRPSRRLSV
ncbi:MAG: hypothetical protein VW840_13140 [Gammaproteobacteria bacterium]